MKVTQPQLSVKPSSSPGMVTLEVTYQASFSPAEQAARQILIERVIVTQNDFAFQDQQTYVEWYGLGSLSEVTLQTLAPEGVLVADAPTKIQVVSWDVNSKVLDVFRLSGPYTEEEAGVEDVIIAHVQLSPYQPPPPVMVDSNSVSGNW